ncbi:MAG: PrsW family intramembrane metalloprotease [Candidatus Heimdallarchaeota archaeon]|nr:PrsW family intramembrane metalloprotease [Candidatus Heimdallarchaeota archaeon]
MWIFENYRWAYVITIVVFIIQGVLWLTYDLNSSIVVAVAVLPIIIYLSLVRYTDVDNPEPRGLISLNLAMGMAILYIIKEMEIFLYNLLMPDKTLEEIYEYINIYLSLSERIYYTFIFAFIVVSLSEEGMKLLAFFILNKWHTQIDMRTDILVYAVAISGGFALIENYQYALGGLSVSYDQGLLITIARTFTAIPLHLGAATYMGVYLSRVYFPISKWDRMFSLIKAFFVPWFIHGLYDFIVFISYREGYYNDIFLALLYSFGLIYLSGKKAIEMRSIEKNRMGIPDNKAKTDDEPDKVQNKKKSKDSPSNRSDLRKS